MNDEVLEKKDDKEYCTLGIEDFAALFGISPDGFSFSIKGKIKKINFRYCRLDRNQRDLLLLGIIKEINRSNLQKVGSQRKNIWESCWNTHKDNLKTSDFSFDQHVPHFVKNYKIIRLNQDYFEAEDADFLYNSTSLLLEYIFEKYLGDIDCLYEFGCGSAHNLVQFAKLYPQKKCYGLDWSESSAEIVNMIAKEHDLNMAGQQFDFFNPDYTLDIDDNSAILTCSVLEQVGERYNEFLEFLLCKKPRLCINIEPILEFYDLAVFSDYLASLYHERRNYLKGFFSKLQRLEDKNMINIVKAKRTYIGNMYNECFSYIVWEINDYKY